MCYVFRLAFFTGLSGFSQIYRIPPLFTFSIKSHVKNKSKKQGSPKQMLCLVFTSSLIYITVLCDFNILWIVYS